MRALIVSPDYASHYLPLSAIGHELRARGLDVVVATGDALERRVIEDGFGHRQLVLGPGSNGELSRVELQPPEEAAQLEAFFDATRRGAAAALRHQAEHRLRDLLWRPADVTGRLAQIVDDVDPDLIVSDQLAYGASLALRALDRPYATLLPGHPTALPLPGETFGVPPYFPPTIRIGAGELAELVDVCSRVERRFAAAFREALAALNPRAHAPANPFAAGGSLWTFVNYPSALAGRQRAMPRRVYLGACVRKERLDSDLAREIADLPSPRAYVSLGSFLSVRDDVIERIVAGLTRRGYSVVLASGVADPGTVGATGPAVVSRRHLPQVAVLPHCDVVVCHGGNNTVTEALHAGLPVLVGPFSTDQFAGAADVRRAGVGDSFDPNRAAPDEIAARADGLLRGPPRRAAAMLGRSLRAQPGAAIAARHLLDHRHVAVVRAARRIVPA